MAKRKPEIRLHSHGIYKQWDADAKELPKIQEFTTRVRAEIDVEFGFIIHIKGAKNQRLYYCIDHPGILDSDGNARPPLDGFVYIRTNDWKFYLGDTIWEPVHDKLGDWRMTLELDNRVIAEKTFELFLDDDTERSNEAD